MPKGVYERKRTDQMAETPQTIAASPDKPKLFPVVLSRNYVPLGEYEIVGYLKEAVRQKDAAGTWRIIEKEEFVEGEMKPAHTPGVGYPNKIWAGTHIRLPLDEAKSIVAKKIAERADAIAA
ncbi:MAG TPA: hypothetical protein PLR85_14400 [Nitrospira sp.]|nr:hypothetical protein [Nitrospira sp.]HNI19893.1 hypothetical protein [Nitrospira sp.]